MRKNVGLVISDSVCTGCGLCAAVCPTKAVRMIVNPLGSPVRYIEENKCISCGKCSSMCPQIVAPRANKPKECLAVFPQKQYLDTRYSSGGAASLIALAFINKTGGSVCGCTWDSENAKARHIIVDTPEELEKFYGSKYVQSDIEQALVEIKKRIEKKRHVLFIGTPCQVAAVQKVCCSKYLFTIDVICHGTPPISYLQDYLGTLSKRMKISDVRFRGEHDFWLTLYGETGKERYCEYKDCDPYFNAFLKGTIYRDNCYTCAYAKVERISDITVGDFWGVDRSILDYDGNVSLVLVNTDNGEQLVLDASKYIDLKERPLEEAVRGNKQLSAPMEITNEQIEFHAFMEQEHNFMRALKKTSDYQKVIVRKKQRHRTMLKHKVKIFLQKILHV